MFTTLTGEISDGPANYTQVSPSAVHTAVDEEKLIGTVQLVREEFIRPQSAFGLPSPARDQLAAH